MGERLYGCIRCPVAVAMKPRQAFAQKGENGRRRIDRVCRDCRQAEVDERARRARERAARVATREIDGVLMRRCLGGDLHTGPAWLPLDETHFPVSRRHPDGSIWRFDYRCKACVSARMVAFDKERRADPVDGSAYRAKRNASQRAWRRRNPALASRYRQAWKQRLVADSERHAAYLADQRITYRLRREAAGLPTKPGHRDAIDAYRVSVGNRANVEGHPAEPLVLWLEAVLAQDHRERVELAAAMQVHERVLWRIEHREFPHVTVGMADAVVWGYGRAVKLPSAETIEQALEQRCRAMPGNGERLLRYIDLAEQVGHLAGAVVDRVEDLWPELAEAR